MNRNEVFAAGEVLRLEAKMAWATLEISADDVSEAQVLISGSDAEVEDLRVGLEGGSLTLEQPSYGLTPRIDLVRWMQVSVRLPRDWRGAVNASTIAGPLRARDLNGSDISLETVSGDLRATRLQAIEAKLNTVTGSLLASGLACERLSVRTISGAAQLDGVDSRAIRFSSVSGGGQVSLIQPFQRLEGTCVSGDLFITVPLSTLRLTARAMPGRVSLEGLTHADDAEPELVLRMVAGKAVVVGNGDRSGE